MKKCLLLALVVVLYLPSRAQTSLFSQDFSSSSTLANYIDAATPGTSKFTAIGVSGSLTTASITGNALTFVRTVSGTAGAAYASRNIGYAATPSVMIAKFDYQLSGNTATTGKAGANTIYMGGNTPVSANYTGSAASPGSGDAFVRLAINYPTNGDGSNTGKFQVQYIYNSTTVVCAPVFSGTVSFTVVANNSASTFTYINPKGIVDTVKTKCQDVWAGTTLIMDGVGSGSNFVSGAPNPTTLDYFKIVRPSVGTVWGTDTYDNFSFSDYSSPSIKTWVGGTGNWNVAGNWSPSGVPGSTNNVVIASGTPSLDIDYTLPANFYLQISGTGKLNINAGKTLTITGAADFGDKAVTLKADNTGAVAAIKNGGTLVGATNVTLQQWVTGQRGYRVLSNPFNSALTPATVGTANGITITGANDVKTFNGVSNTWTGSISPIPANTPYSVFVRGLTSEVTGLNYTAGPTAFAYGVTGTLNSIPVSLSQNTGATEWNIIGNPLPAPVNSSALTGAVANTPYYIYSMSQNNTGTRVKAGGWVAASSNSSTTTPIPMMGVVAYLSGTGSTFNVTSSDINTSNSAQTGLFGLNDATTQVELQLSKDGNYQDRLFVRFDANSTEKGTERMDLPKISNDVTNIYTVTSDKAHLAVDARTGIDASIPVGITSPAGNYTFTVASNNFVNASNMYLVDKLLNTKTKLEAGATYSFTITADPATQGDSRFELGAIKTPTQDVVASEAFTAKVLGNVVSNIATVQVRGAKSTAVQITVTDMQGKIITNTTSSNTINKISLAGGSGMYVIKVTDGENSIINKVVKP